MNISRATVEQLQKYNIKVPRSDEIATVVEGEKVAIRKRVDELINEALKDIDKTQHILIPEEETKSISNEPHENINIQIKMLTKHFNPKEMKKCDKWIAHKYFHIWKQKIDKNKMEMQSVKIQEEEIDLFITNLTAKNTNKNPIKKVRITTAKPQASNANAELFENRYKAQRDIILMQKSKLLEQERLIQELQFGKISDELKTSIEDSQSTIKKLLRKFTARTKIVAGVLVGEEPEAIQVKINKVPELVRQMEQRAEERALKRQIIQERKRLIDEEKQKLMEELALKKRTQDDEEKRRNLEAIKERRRKEVEDEKRRQLEKAKYLEKCKCADAFYKKYLKQRTVKAFKLLLERCESNLIISHHFHAVNCLRKYFHEWRLHTQTTEMANRTKAVQHYELKLKRKTLNVLLWLHCKSKQNLQVAIDYHAYQLQCVAFKNLYLIVNESKIRRYHLMQFAMKHYKTHLLVQAFYRWKSLPAVLQLERAKEERKRKWREKVLEIIPDYQPPILW